MCNPVESPKVLTVTADKCDVVCADEVDTTGDAKGYKRTAPDDTTDIGGKTADVVIVSYVVGVIKTHVRVMYLTPLGNVAKEPGVLVHDEATAMDMTVTLEEK